MILALTLGKGAEAQHAIVCFQVAVQDADAVHGFDGAEEFDGEEHGDAFVQGAGCVGAAGGVAFGEVDEVEQRALV